MNDTPSLPGGVTVQVDPALGPVEIVAEGKFRIAFRRPALYVCPPTLGQSMMRARGPAAVRNPAFFENRERWRFDFERRPKVLARREQMRRQGFSDAAIEAAEPFDSSVPRETTLLQAEHQSLARTRGPSW
jgi:hypothetical protein